MTVSGRLRLIGGLLLLCLLTLFGVGVVLVAEHIRSSDGPQSVAVSRNAEVSQLDWLLEQHQRTMERVSHEHDSARLALDSRAADELMLRLDQLARRPASAIPVEIRNAFPGLWKRADEVLRLAAAGERQSAIAAFGHYETAASQVRARIWQVRRQDADTTGENASNSERGASLAVIAVGASVALLLVGMLAAIEVRGMLLRLNRVSDAMLHLARNDADVRVEELADADDVGDVRRAVSVFRDNAVRLQQVNRWLDVALSFMNRGLSIFDDDCRLLVCNATYRRIYELPEDLVRPGTPFERIAEHRLALVASLEGTERGAAGLVPAVRGMLRQGAGGNLRQQFVDGRTIEISVRPLPSGGWVALHEDVTERLAAAERVERLARQDALTGLANRPTFQAFLDRMTGELAAGEGFAVFMIDLDRFKEVNDSFGHPVGDAVLTAAGRRLTDLTRRDDLVARLGGDEFAVIQKGVCDRGFASAVAHRMIEALHLPLHVHGQRISIGGTVGIALAPEHGRNAGELMKNAGLALSCAKLERRGTLRFFDPAMDRLMRSRRVLEADLAQAAARGELELYYQPIVSLDERRVTGCEALIRWRHPHRGYVSPAEFIPLAEESGLICGIGAWALGEACQAAAHWPDALRVAVNLSVAQFAGPDLATITANALAASGLEPRRLELEVTESLLLGDDPATLALLHRLRGLGLGIALDDFGTGYSCLSHLRSFPFDKIKIDRTFVRDLPQMKNCEAIVGAVARLAASLDMTTVAEGVESDEHLARVEAAGCDAVQGYLFSPPVAQQDLLAVIEDINVRLGGPRTAPMHIAAVREG